MAVVAAVDVVATEGADAGATERGAITAGAHERGHPMIHTLLPEQFLSKAGVRAVEPQRRLMLAVLQTVVDDCREPAVAAAPEGAPRESRAFTEAKRYVASRDRSWPYSFENVCEAIGVDPDRVRVSLGLPRELDEPVRATGDAA